MNMERIEKLEKEVRVLKDRLHSVFNDTAKVVKSVIKKSWKLAPQAETLFGLYTALVVDTKDPNRNGRIRFYTPLLHHPDTQILQLPWAIPVANMGGFDDCGLTWPPPAGSTVCILFESGSKGAPYYFGTTWHGDRGTSSNRKFAYGIKEFEDIHEGHRLGYQLGPNDGSQVYQPWNTESYNSFDPDSTQDSTTQQDALEDITYPNIYGFKTPQKHTVKMTDGDYTCNHRHKRFELISSGGCTVLMKDDRLHPAGQWCHGGTPGTEPSKCSDEDGKPLETGDCDPGNKQTFQNPYFKQEHEQRAYKGPGTPQNNKITLQQSGYQVLSISGHTMLFDDSVEQPKPSEGGWEDSVKDFDFGCTNRFIGKIQLISATGHKIHISDEEVVINDIPIRGPNNFMKILSADGNRIELNDHKKAPGIAGSKCGITMETTSTHLFEMIDTENEQETSQRKEGGTPIAKAKGGYIRLRTGYGLQFHMADCDEPGKSDGSQEETVNQNIQFFCPMKDNVDRGPHILRFQEKKEGPGQVYLRVGGDFICQTNDTHFTIVGTPENPSDKRVDVSRNYITNTSEVYYNKADSHTLWSDTVMFLLAGNDCEDSINGTTGPCVAPVLCLGPKGITVSDRVFVSASPNAGCASIYQMLPFHDCTTPVAENIAQSATPVLPA